MLKCSRRKRSRAACASTCESEYAAGALAAVAEPVVLPLHGHDLERRDRDVQLLTRHWIITDGTGQVEEVKGPGVVGKQPTLAPGESFDYTSGCPLLDAVRRHGRHLPDGRRRRRPVRRDESRPSPSASPTRSTEQRVGIGSAIRWSRSNPATSTRQRLARRHARRYSAAAESRSAPNCSRWGVTHCVSSS